jgi:transcriptional regulator with XRE-family HTH domain
MTNNIRDELGQRLREARQRRGASREEMAELFHLKLSSYLKWERGKIPHTRMLFIQEKLKLDEQLLPIRTKQLHELTADELLTRYSQALGEAKAGLDELIRRRATADTTGEHD